MEEIKFRASKSKSKAFEEKTEKIKTKKKSLSDKKKSPKKFSGEKSTECGFYMERCKKGSERKIQ